MTVIGYAETKELFLISTFALLTVLESDPVFELLLLPPHALNENANKTDELNVVKLKAFTKYLFIAIPLLIFIEKRTKYKTYSNI